VVARLEEMNTIFSTTNPMSNVHQRQAGGCAILVIGLIFAVIGGCKAWFLGPDLTLTCKRSTDACILEKTNMKRLLNCLKVLALSAITASAAKGGCYYTEPPVYDLRPKSTGTSISGT
jgi:hypothetical protein